MITSRALRSTTATATSTTTLPRCWRLLCQTIAGCLSKKAKGKYNHLLTLLLFDNGAVVRSMQSVIFQLVDTSTDFFDRPLACLRALRRGCVQVRPLLGRPGNL